MKKLAAALTALTLIISIAGCGEGAASDATARTATVFAMDTFVTVTAYCGDETLEKVGRLVTELDGELSRTKADSDIGLLNASGTDGVTVGDAAAELLKFALACCEASGGIATQFCPESTTSVETFILIRSGSQFDKFDDEYLFKAMPNAVRTDISTDEFVKQFSPCSVHAVGSTGVFELKQEAESMIATVLDFMQNNHLSEETAYLLNYDIEQLRHTLSGYEYSEIESFLQTLTNDYTGAKGEVAAQQQQQEHAVDTYEDGGGSDADG